ncbi:hypothetical protein [Anaerobacillus alkalidiazotrophicus]|uniref:hypothetical protein n=1 Tax=Anaerobacillus alkalidiazotrophicus TaxID=472963 RepID=UPI001471F42B|nr:hypothetical protein [Anaerobacillus alkalidiazotrophicus]
MFFVFLLGMFFGIHIFYQISPLFGGLLLGVVGASLGNTVEKYYVAKVGYLKSKL